MSTEKIQTFLDVLSGEQPQSVLAPLLTDDEPWLKDAVEVVVSERLAQAQSGKQAQFRVVVYESTFSKEMEQVEAQVEVAGEMRTVRGVRPKRVEREIETSPWLPESDPRFSAPLLMGQLRQKFPNAQMRIERR